MADQVDDLDGATYIDPSLGAAVEYAYRIVLEFFGEQPAVRVLANFCVPGSSDASVRRGYVRRPLVPSRSPVSSTSRAHT